MTLLDAGQNRLYRVTGISGDRLLRRRLLDMGFTPDTRIFVAGKAPFGGTVLVGIRGILIALREDAAGLVFISDDLGAGRQGLEIGGRDFGDWRGKND